MKITPIIGNWYLASNGTSRYIVQDTGESNSSTSNFLSKKWRSIPDGDWKDNMGGFTELIEEIPCPDEFAPKIVQTLIFN